MTRATSILVVLLSGAFATDSSWYISRADWGALLPAEKPVPMFKPAPLVVINHSEGHPCYTLETCSRYMRNIQSYYIDVKRYADFPYNFAIGTDGLVYEGRGWERVGAHTLGYNTCALGIGFLGNYTHDGTDVTEDQIVNMKRILAEGVELGHLSEDYVMVGHRDIRNSDTPGDKLYELMKTWPRYNTDRYGKKKCDEILQEINNL